MEIIKISEALKEIGKPISGIHGTIKAVFKQRSGVGQYGPWTMQDVVIKDETGEISVTFSGMPDLKPRIGTRVTLASSTIKGVIKGVAVIEDSWDDKKTGKPKKSIKLKLDKDAFIDFGTEPVSEQTNQASAAPVIPDDADDEEKALLAALAKKKAEKEAARLAAEAQAKAKAVSDDKAPPLNGMNYAAVKRRIIQTANLYSYALRSAKWALAKHELEIKDLTTSAATLFIAFREDKLVDAMPMNLIDFEAPEPEEECHNPEEQPEPEVDQEPKTWQEVKHNGVALGYLPAGEIEMLFNTFKPKINPKTGNYDMSDLYLVNALKAWKKEQV